MHFNVIHSPIREESFWSIAAVADKARDGLKQSYAMVIIIRDSRKSRQKMVKRHGTLLWKLQNHGRITAVYITANLLKLMVSNSRKIYYDDVAVTCSTEKYLPFLCFCYQSPCAYTDFGSRSKGKVNIFVLNSHNKLQIMLIKNKIFL